MQEKNYMPMCRVELGAAGLHTADVVPPPLHRMRGEPLQTLSELTANVLRANEAYTLVSTHIGRG